jgi:hypothetical protein
MKTILFLSLLSASLSAFSSDDWKLIAETVSCDQKIQILGKAGEKYVLAVRGDETTKLFSKDGSAFNEDSMKSTEFEARGSTVAYTFFQPSYVEANPPKIDVKDHGLKKRCKMELNR